MAVCEVCGNDYDKAFEVHMEGSTHTFDSFECAGVPWAVFTHCGSEIVKADARAVAGRVAALGGERGVRAEIARDGLELALR